MNWPEICAHLKNVKSKFGTVLNPWLLGPEVERCWHQFAALTSDADFQPILGLLELEYWSGI